MPQSPLWGVALLSPPYTTLSYAQPLDFPDATWWPGQRVLVPVRKQTRMGVLMDRVSLDINPGKVKAILWPAESTPLFPLSFVRLILALGARCVNTPGRVLASVLPSRIKDQGQILVNQQGQRIQVSRLVTLDPQERETWVQQWREGQAWFKAGGSASRPQVWTLACHPPWPLRPQASRQMQVLDHLWTQGPSSSRDLSRSLGSWAPRALKEVVHKGLVAKHESPTPNTSDSDPHHAGDLPLSADQQQVLTRLQEDLAGQRSCTRLLFGVTGSGKTLVYARLAAACLDQGRSVLVLVPEVALAMQVYAQLQAFLPQVELRLYHGSLPGGERSELYARTARDPGPVLVVGTRSAVFLPRQDWDLVIVDEEHDASYKQEERFTYQAKEVAYFLSQEHKSLLLLGSATPDIKTFHACKQAEVGMLSMPTRISGHPLPEIEVVNLLQEPPEDGPFSPTSRQALEACLHKGEQAIILLNRRGYAPLVYCTSCDQVVRCEHCAVGLTYHKGLQRLVCHYCGHTRPFPSPCTHCGGHQFVPMSEGTEQIEEYLRTRLDPDITTLRLDRDSTRRQGSMEDIMDRFSQGQAQILVGTQMCSKGHNFPQVTLVIVLDGDVGLNLPDYKATERTFQLLVQVAGRAGRGERPGTVFIQTRNPEHYCWRFVQAYDFEGFYAHEIALRQRMNYPPFVKLALVRISVPSDLEQEEQLLQDLGRLLRQEGKDRGVQVLGPAPAPLSRLRGRLRFQCLLKAGTWGDIRGVYAAWTGHVPRKSQCRISLDLDPVQML